MLFRQISKERACPACHSKNVYRVRNAGLTVRAVCRILQLRPRWCADCDTFFLSPRNFRRGRPEDDGGEVNVKDHGAARAHAGGASH